LSKYDFLVVAPPFSSRSGGVMVLHELCSTLNQIGYRAGILYIIEGSQQDQGFKFAYSNEKSLQDPDGIYFDFISNKSEAEIGLYIRNACLIYPDIVKGNPAGGKTYATYVLGRPQFKIESNFIASYSKLYIDHADLILYKPFISEWMHALDTQHWSKRKLDLTYIGKGHEYTECRHIPGSVLVERDWPRDKRQLAALLRNCRYFFSWDTVSATNTDAVLCGAVPVLMHDLQIPRAVLDTGEHGPFPPSSYFPGFELAELPANLDAIDKAILGMQKSLSEHLFQWPQRVKELATAIANQ
jgi:hypothetical protein